MDVNKSSESLITITVSISVELRALLDEGTQPFAVRCREALEEELAPILTIGQRTTAPAPAPPEAAAPAPVPDAEPELPEPSGPDYDAAIRSLNPPSNLTPPGISSMETQTPPTSRRSRA